MITFSSNYHSSGGMQHRIEKLSFSGPQAVRYTQKCLNIKPRQSVLMGNPIPGIQDEIDQRWTFASSLDVENPAVGEISRLTLNFSVKLKRGEDNWVLASVPAPNVTEGWEVKSVMLRYRISGEGGKIDKIGLRNGDVAVHQFEGLGFGDTGGWQTAKLTLLNSAGFAFGLGVSIHLNGGLNTARRKPDGSEQDGGDGGGAGPPPTVFAFASVGLEFIKPGVVGPQRNP
jgi:hypothetical protein